MSQAVSTHDEERSRRNLRLALVHAALALGFLAWFVWAQVHR